MPIQRAKPRFTEVKNVTNITADKLNIGQIGGRRNIIINGAMQVAQRGTSVTGVTSGGYKTCDRWTVSNTSQGTWTISQSSTAPSDFANSLKFDCTTADGTTNASDQLGVDTRIEAKDLIQLNYGTSSAKTITLSFHVRSNKTGTYTFEAYAQDPNRGFSKTYTIDSADTWEKKEIIIPGDTSASTNFNDDAEIGIIFKWWLAAGSTFTGGTYTDNVWRANTNANRVSSSNVNLADSTDNEWYITGVQLEVGEQATPFEHRSFAEELALCHRYFHRANTVSVAATVGAGVWYATNQVLGDYRFPRMRSTPSASVPATNSLKMYKSGAAIQANTSTPIDNASADGFARFNITPASNGTAGQGSVIQLVSTSDYLDMDAEL